MKQTLLFFSLFLTLIIQSRAQSSNLEAYWQDGLKFRSKDGLYKFSVGGRVHYDIAFLRHSGALDTLFESVNDNVEVRRARIGFEGNINKALAYEFEFTFGETIKYADMYIAFLRMPFFERLIVGHFREPFGLEENTSSNAIVFMERSLTSAFGPGRNTGLMVQKPFFNEKLRIYAGVFRITDDLGADLLGENKHSVTSRIAFNPIYDTTTNKALHIGMAINSYTPLANIYQVKTEMEAHTGLSYINTGKIERVNNVRQIGGEFGYTKDRLTIQSEYIHSISNPSKSNDSLGNRGNRNFRSYYATASYFLKGGIRRYNNGANRFSSIALTENYERGSLSGAWEAGIRFSHISVDDAVADIRRTSNVTLGLNWYFNSNSRIMMNYILSRLQNKYTASALQFRVQVTF